MPEGLSAPPRLGVFYDEGAAGPGEIAAAARACGVALFLIVDQISPHVRRLLPGLRNRFDLCDITGLTPEGAEAAVSDRRPDGLVTFSEPCLTTTGRLAAAAGVRHWHSPRACLALTDKHRQRRALADAGIDATACAVVRDDTEIARAVEAVGLPLVLKPCTGTGSSSVRRANSAAEAEAAAREYFRDGTGGAVPLLVERLLVGDPGQAGAAWGDYVSVETAVHDGVCRALCITGKFPLVEPFRERGSFVPHTLDQPSAAAVNSMAEAAIRALGVRDGIVHTEVKLTAQGPRIIEVNGRVGGLVADLLRRGAGFDLVEAAMRLALGSPVETAPVFDGVTYQYTLVPPADARSLVRVAGIDRLRALPGIDLADVRTTPGQALDWRSGAAGRLGRLYGQVADHSELERLAKAIEGAYEPTYVYTEGTEK